MTQYRPILPMSNPRAMRANPLRIATNALRYLVLDIPDAANKIALTSNTILLAPTGAHDIRLPAASDCPNVTLHFVSSSATAVTIKTFAGATLGTVATGRDGHVTSDGTNWLWSSPATTPLAAGVTFSNVVSGLAATTVQGAIDEVEGRVGDAESDIGRVFGVLATASITCPSVVGGATDTTFTLQLVSPDGTNLAAAKTLAIKGGQASLTWVAVVGTVDGGSGTSNVTITTDATGKFSATITNTDDETLYLYAASELYAGAGKGVVIIPSPLVTVSWAA